MLLQTTELDNRRQTLRGARRRLSLREDDGRMDESGQGQVAVRSTRCIRMKRSTPFSIFLLTERYIIIICFLPLFLFTQVSKTSSPLRDSMVCVPTLCEYVFCLFIQLILSFILWLPPFSSNIILTQRNRGWEEEKHILLSGFIFSFQREERERRWSASRISLLSISRATVVVVVFLPDSASVCPHKSNILARTPKSRTTGMSFLCGCSMETPC